MRNSDVRSLAQRTSQGWKDWLKLGVALLRHPRAVRGWLDFVAKDPLLSRIDDARLLSKVTRPYLDQGLAAPARAALLMRHYGWIHAQGLDDLTYSAFVAPRRLCQWQGKGGVAFELILIAVHDGHREGELSLCLQMQGRTLYTLTGLVDPTPLQGPTLIVGRLQGDAADDAAERIRQATKELHACRPSHLLVSAATSWAHAMGCAQLDLVANRRRVAINLWRKRRIVADNERLWKEMGATLAENGRWRLASRGELTLDLDSVPSRKRAEARRRMEMLQAVSGSLHQFMRQALRTAAG